MKFLDRFTDDIWSRRASDARQTDIRALRILHPRAQRLAESLRNFLAIADDRIRHAEGRTYPLNAPHESDWIRRPTFWTKPLSPQGLAPVANGAGLGPEIQFFHDCPLGQIVARQSEQVSRLAIVPYALRLETFGFEGSFLSIVHNLDATGIAGLTGQHIVRLEIEGETDRDLSAFVRLNVQHGPNVAQLVSQFDFANPQPVDFDLAYSDINAKRVSAAWVEIIVNDPQASRILIRDIICSRRLRAEF